MTNHGVTQDGERDVAGAGIASGLYYPAEAMLMPCGAMKGKAATLRDYLYTPRDSQQFL